MQLIKLPVNTRGQSCTAFVKKGTLAQSYDAIFLNPQVKPKGPSDVPWQSKIFLVLKMWLHLQIRYIQKNLHDLTAKMLALFL